MIRIAAITLIALATSTASPSAPTADAADGHHDRDPPPNSSKAQRVTVAEVLILGVYYAECNDGTFPSLQQLHDFVKKERLGEFKFGHIQRIEFDGSSKDSVVAKFEVNASAGTTIRGTVEISRADLKRAIEAIKRMRDAK